MSDDFREASRKALANWGTLAFYDRLFEDEGSFLDYFLNLHILQCKFAVSYILVQLGSIMPSFHLIRVGG